MSNNAWRPHPGPQTDFCKSGEFECFFGGSAGPGKTDCLLMIALRHVDKPGYHGLLLRRTFPQLQEIIDRCHIWYPMLGGFYKSAEHRWYFPSGATIDLGHMQYDNDRFRYHGKEFQYVGFDELTLFSETQYLFMLSRIRSTDPSIPTRVRATSNPGGIGHKWVFDRFIDGKEPYKPYIDPATGMSRIFIPATVYDNPSLIQSDPLYVKRLEALPEIDRKRYLYGDWETFTGQAFGDLSRQIHSCDPFEIPATWFKWMSFDWGYSRPFCALWFAMDTDGVIYLYRELYGMEKNDPNKGLRLTNKEICAMINNIEKEKVNARVADPACWGPTKIKGSNTVFGPSFVEDASREGLFFLKGDNDRLRGRQQIHMRLQVDQEEDENGVVIGGEPKFLAFNTCTRWWEEMTTLVESERNPEDIETKQPDEGYDCTRYALLFRPLRPKIPDKKVVGSFQSERKKYMNAKRYAERKGVSLADAYGRVRG